MKKLNELVDNYRDFPIKGIDFKDVLGILQEPDVFKELINEMSQSSIIKNSEAIISIDARGFIFGSAISLYSSKPMLVGKKPGNSTGELITRNYDFGSTDMEKIRFLYQKSSFG